jgi:hypothetical protein
MYFNFNFRKVYYSAIDTNVFVTPVIQVIQLVVMRLQDKYAGCKLTVRMVISTTPTTLLVIVVRALARPLCCFLPLKMRHTR